MITRRALLVSAPAVPLMHSAKRYRPVFAGQAYVWSQHFARQQQKLEDHYGPVLKSFHDAGYDTMELVAEFFRPEFAERTAGFLRRYKLKAPVVYNGGEMHTEAGAEKTISGTLELARRVKKVMGRLDAINFNPNPLPNSRRKTDEQLKIQAAALNRMAIELKGEHARLFIHQHAPEMMENSREWRHVLTNTDPALVLFCLDAHWVHRGNQNVMTLLREAGPRLASLHLRNSKSGTWLEEFADGDVDYRAVAGYLRNFGFQGYLVVELAWDKETEITRPLESSLRRSLEYARQVFRS